MLRRAGWRGLVLLLLLLGTGGGAYAQEAATRGLNVRWPFGPRCPPDEWVPLQLEFVNPTDQAGDGTGTIPIADTAGGTVIRVPAQVPAQSRVRRIAYACFKPSAGAANGRRSPSGPMICTWVGTQGARLARTELAVSLLGEASAVAPGSGSTDADPAAGTLLLSIQGEDQSPLQQPVDTGALATVLATAYEIPVMPAAVPARSAPAEAVGYDACRFVVLSGGMNPDGLDQAQRQALLAYVRGGGILVLAAPTPTEVDGSWLAPYLPVQVIGQRQAWELSGIALGPQAAPPGSTAPGSEADAKVGGTGVLKFRQTVAICEAVQTVGSSARNTSASNSAGTGPTRTVTGDDVVVLRDGQYVHAAYKPVGLGRVVFTSFPEDALAEDEQSIGIWRSVLGEGEVPSGWRGTKLGQQRQQFLQEMLGRPAAPLGAAAAVTGGYVAGIVLLQMLAGRTGRPKAFAALSAGALLLSAALVSLTLVKHGESPLIGARLAVVDLAADGGGLQQEVFAYAGQDVPELALEATSPQVSLKPLVSTEAAAPVLEQRPPMGSPNAGAWAQRVKRVWEAGQVLGPQYRIAVRAAFGPGGLKLAVDNQFGDGRGGELLAPLLLWEGSRFSLHDLPPGESSTAVGSGSRNAGSDYTNTSVLASEAARQRGEILRASLTPGDGQRRLAEASRPTLTAWVEDGSLPWLVQTGPAATARPLPKSQVLVRVPVRVEPSPAGQRVRIEGSFTRIVTQGLGRAPYDPASRQWSVATGERSWVFGFAWPQQVGRLKVLRATVQADLSAPGQTIIVRRGQCPNGNVNPRPNNKAPMVAEWRNPIGRRTATLECQPEDLDEQGRLWLGVQVTGPRGDAQAALGPAAGGNWEISGFEVGYEAEVVGPE